MSCTEKSLTSNETEEKFYAKITNLLAKLLNNKEVLLDIKQVLEVWDKFSIVCKFMYAQGEREFISFYV